MSLLEGLSLVLLVALLVPVVSVILDAPLFRRRRASAVAPPETQAVPAPLDMEQLTRRMMVLEDELDDLSRSVRELHDETAFLRNLLERPHDSER